MNTSFDNYEYCYLIKVKVDDLKIRTDCMFLRHSNGPNISTKHPIQGVNI